MEKLTKEELKKAIAGMEQDRSILIDKLQENKKERKELEDDLEYYYESIQDMRKRLEKLGSKPKPKKK